MTTLTQAREAIYQRFLDQWATPAFVVFENEDADFDSGEIPWVRLSVHELTSSQETLGPSGGRKFRRFGSVIVQVFTEVNQGMKQAGDRANDVRAIFEGVSFSGLDFNDVTVREGVPDGKWQITLVEAFFDYEETK